MTFKEFCCIHFMKKLVKKSNEILKIIFVKSPFYPPDFRLTFNVYLSKKDFENLLFFYLASLISYDFWTIYLFDYSSPATTGMWPGKFPVVSSAIVGEFAEAAILLLKLISPLRVVFLSSVG